MVKKPWKTPESLDQWAKDLYLDILRQAGIKQRFSDKWASLPADVKDTHPADKVFLLIKTSTEAQKTKFINMARLLGMSVNITMSYLITGEKTRKSVLAQAKDYCKLLYNPDLYLDQIINRVVAHNNQTPCPVDLSCNVRPKPLPKTKHIDMDRYYKYLEHLAQ